MLDVTLATLILDFFFPSSIPQLLRAMIDTGFLFGKVWLPQGMLVFLGLQLLLLQLKKKIFMFSCTAFILDWSLNTSSLKVPGDGGEGVRQNEMTLAKMNSQDKMSSSFHWCLYIYYLTHSLSLP